MAKNMVMGFLFSYFGLFIIIIIYCSLGALLFGALEGGDMDEWLDGRVNASIKIEAMRKELIQWLREMKDAEYIDIRDTERHRNTSTTIWMDLDGKSLYTARKMVKDKVDRYHLEIARAIHEFSYDGELERATSMWSFSSAMLFTTSIVTLIGYGHIAPTSDFGYLMTILFALLGVPLMLMFVANVGQAFQTFLRLTLKYACCGICRRRRKKTHGVVGLTHYPHKPAETGGDTEAAGDGTDGDGQPKDNVVSDADGGNILDDQFAGESGDPEVVDLTGDDECPDPNDPSSELAPEHVPIPLTCIFFLLIAYNMAGAFLFMYTEGWSLLESNYFCFVSLLTIGFGDYWPGSSSMHTFAGKLHLAFGCVYIVLGLGVLGMGINVIVMQIVLKARAIGRATGVVQAQDADGDGMDDGDEEIMRQLNMVM